MDYETALATAKERGSRESLLQKLPALREAFEAREKVYGQLVNGGSLTTFKDGRLCLLFQYENVYEICLHNPENPDETRDKTVFLSREAMNGLWSLYEIFGDLDRDIEAYRKAIQGETTNVS